MNEKAPSNENQILIYKTEAGQYAVEVLLDGDTVWLTQNQMAELFQTTKQNVGMHIKNIFNEAELKENSVVK
ncbi:MAG TPA: cytochrome C biogenesis protein CycH, partial [Coxiellaceae bacterium]|nr:cytochrome C biogenesis protein CycH [Coxiellaceae bacterium]